MERAVRKKQRVLEGANHFLAPSTSLGFIKSGCTLLDLVLGGGWPLGRISNIVGDKSTGKTLLAIEACANFIRDWPKAKIWYAEAEAAFDKQYAHALGMPIDRVKFVEDMDTVEDFYNNLIKCIQWCEENNRPGLYILDSLDALSDSKEMERAIDKDSYGAEKAKFMSKLFRKIRRALRTSNVHLLIISQVRDKIGISFGRKTSRSGGKALDFYASQVLYLAPMGDIYRSRKGIKRVVAIRVKAKCDKNKIGLPRRECEFVIRFGYGIDDVHASLNFLAKTRELSRVGVQRKGIKKFLGRLDLMDNSEYNSATKSIREAVRKVWREAEQEFLPKRRKYG